MTSPSDDIADTSAVLTPRMRFRFSVQTLLWVMTGCAVVSAVLGWIGPEWGLFFVLGLPQGLLWGVPLTRLALRSLRYLTPPDAREKVMLSVLKVMLSVIWTSLMPVVVLADVAAGGGIVGWLSYSGSSRTVGALVAAFFSLQVAVLFAVLIAGAAAALVVPVASLLASFFLALTRPWNRRPTRPTTLASITGGLTGSVPLILTAGSMPSAPFPAEAVFVGLLPIAIGFVVPPLLVWWADRLGPILAAPPVEAPTFRESRRR